MGINEMIGLGRKKKTVTQGSVDAVKTGEVCVILDHPQQGEKITAPHYTFRVGTFGDIKRVEISINKGPWQACRHSVGYWWYDWSGYKGGRYQAVVKAWTKDGQMLTCELCDFQVVGEKRKTTKNA
ncbi:MAG: hypothetical protein KKH28_12485 [Elusimicrobia bacterium]|nr:hypothetical protein [Elusimicrobiota bacterium]